MDPVREGVNGRAAAVAMSELGQKATSDRKGTRLLYPQERTSALAVTVSALCQSTKSLRDNPLKRGLAEGAVTYER